MISIEAAATSHVGKVRKANEDGFYEGESVFAVADGMGGHLAGEIASATALEPIAALDGRVFADAPAAVSALREAVSRANRAVAAKAADDPHYRGMGTTLTAVMVEGRRLHVAHVGDSRAYLLRSGTFSQLTTDHTLVQHLIDEGQLTAEEAETHPQRSIVTRAIGVSSDVDVDTLSLGLETGDQILLCSDGLTGVVDDEHIRQELTGQHDTSDAVQRLVTMANSGGGPDNITVLLLRISEPERTGNGQPVGTQPVTAASTIADGQDHIVAPRPLTDGQDHDWAERLRHIGTLGKPPREPFRQRSGPSRAQRLGAVALALVLLVALVGAGGWWLLSRSYYVGVDGTDVAIYRGVPGSLGPLDLSWVDERTPVRLEDVFPVERRPAFRRGVPAANRTDARQIVAALMNRRDAPTRGSPTPTPDTTTPPSPTPAPTGQIGTPSP